jgi:hypothetical protein
MGTFARLKQRLDQAARVARTTARDPHINVTGRKNIQIAANIGRRGASERAAAVQHAPVVQDDTSR